MLVLPTSSVSSSTVRSAAGGPARLEQGASPSAASMPVSLELCLLADAACSSRSPRSRTPVRAIHTRASALSKDAGRGLRWGTGDGDASCRRPLCRCHGRPVAKPVTDPLPLKV